MKNIKPLLAAALALGLSYQCIYAEANTAAIHLNKASLQQLVALHGIGESKAKRILAYREKHGPFKNLAELANVKGISEKTLVRLQAKNPQMQL